MSTRLSVILSILTLLVAVPFAAKAATSGGDSLSFSITPTLLEMSAVPGQSWRTSVKVINNNPYQLTVYANPVNFEPVGEFGHGRFSSVGAMTGSTTLASWMHVSADPIVIPKESSKNIPVTLQLPKDAAPGGHYAALLIGTKPPAGSAKLQIKTSQVIASLFFVTVAGDVIENGQIRTFRTTKSVVTTPTVDFQVRFENKGNVHLQPRGMIVITNMWGKERGRIPINEDGGFGNVLPNSIRQFDFSWTGQQSLADIGRYKAELSLGYGKEKKQFVSRAVYFWVVPLKAVTITLVSILVTAWFLIRSVRAYVRHMLRMSGIDPDTVGRTESGRSYVPQPGDVRIGKGARAVRAADSPKRLWSLLMTLWSWFQPWYERAYMLVREYRAVIIPGLIFLVLVVPLSFYLAPAFRSLRNYTVTIIRPDHSTVTMSSEQIIHNEQTPPLTDAVSASTTIPATATSSATSSVQLILVNSSDTPGMAGRLSDQLTAKGYTVDSLQSDFGPSKSKTVVVYPPSALTAAKELSGMLQGALLSAYDGTSTASSTITIYIGNDYAAMKP